MTCPACRRDNCPTMAEAENTADIVAGVLDCQLARTPLPTYEPLPEVCGVCLDPDCEHK